MVSQRQKTHFFCPDNHRTYCYVCQSCHCEQRVLLQQGNWECGGGQHMDCEVLTDSGQNVECEVLTDSEHNEQCEVLTDSGY